MKGGFMMQSKLYTKLKNPLYINFKKLSPFMYLLFMHLFIYYLFFIKRFY